MYLGSAVLDATNTELCLDEAYSSDKTPVEGGI